MDVHHFIFFKTNSTYVFLRGFKVSHPASTGLLLLSVVTDMLYTYASYIVHYLEDIWKWLNFVTLISSVLDKEITEQASTHGGGTGRLHVHSCQD